MTGHISSFCLCNYWAVVKAPTLQILLTSHQQEGVGCLITAGQGWKFRPARWSPLIPHGGEQGSRYLLAGMKVPAPYLAAFSSRNWGGATEMRSYSPAKWKFRLPTQPLEFFSEVFDWSRVLIVHKFSVLVNCPFAPCPGLWA